MRVCLRSIDSGDQRSPFILRKRRRTVRKGVVRGCSVLLPTDRADKSAVKQVRELGTEGGRDKVCLVPCAHS